MKIKLKQRAGPPGREMTRLERWVYSALGLAFLLLLYQSLALILRSPVLPPLGRLLPRLGQVLTGKSTYVGFAFSLLRLLLVLACSMAAGTVLGWVGGYFPRFGQSMRPLVSALTAFPTICIILVLVVFTNLTAYVVVFIVTAPVIYEAVANGTSYIAKRYGDELRLVQSSECRKLTKIVAPLAAPYVLLGLLQSSGLGLKVLIMAEILAGSSSSKGIGNLINNSYLNSDYVAMYAYSFIAVIVIIALDIALRAFKRSIEQRLAEYN